MIQTSYDEQMMNFSMGLVDLAWTTGCFKEEVAGRKLGSLDDP